MRLLEKLCLLYQENGICSILSLALYPIITPLYLIGAWFNSLWNSKKLLYGKWSKYHGFDPLTTANFFFYKTQWLNFDKYGRCGVSPVVGLGNYPLSRWFHLTLVSCFFYANAGAVTMLLGTLVWIFSHLIWIQTRPWEWVTSVVALLFLSSTSYSMAFVRQNYNIMGWLWIPIGLFAISTQQHVLASLMWLGAAFCSFTAVFCTGFFLLLMSVINGDWTLFATAIPAFFKLSLCLLPVFARGDFKATFLNTAKIIGLTRKNTKYRRNYTKLNIFNFYHATIYAFSCFLLLWQTQSIPQFAIIGLLLFFINQFFIRFADDQSVIIFFLSLFAVECINNDPSVIIILSIIVAFFPAIPFTDANYNKKNICRPKIYSPFDHTEIIESLNSFFSPIQPGSRILFAFEDPKNSYHKIFDKCGGFLPLFVFTATSRGIHLMPDWYSIAETNHISAPDFWGRTPNLVLENLKLWKADYAIIYFDTNEISSCSQWNTDFTLISTLCWDHVWERAFSSGVDWKQSPGPREILLLKPLVETITSSTMKAGQIFRNRNCTSQLQEVDKPDYE